MPFGPPMTLAEETEYRARRAEAQRLASSWDLSGMKSKNQISYQLTNPLGRVEGGYKAVDEGDGKIHLYSFTQPTPREAVEQKDLGYVGEGELETANKAIREHMKDLIRLIKTACNADIRDNGTGLLEELN